MEEEGKADESPGQKNLPLTLKMKPRQVVQLGELRAEQSGCSVMDVGFPNVFYVEVGEIHVKNYYTAWLSVQAKFREQGVSESDVKYRTVVERFPLMPEPHCDGGAEEWFTISRKHMLCALSNIISLRLILRQPSPLWKEYRLDDVVCYKTSVSAPPDIVLPAWVTEAKKPVIHQKLKGICSMEKLSTHLQRMWATADTMDSVQPTTSIGRYDVDGTYEINLLSYT